MQQSDLPEGSGDEESPEELAARGDRAAVRKMYEAYTRPLPGRRDRRRYYFNDYSAKNCEEAWGGRAQAPPEVGRHPAE